jgi:hypothetical protein
MHIPDILMISSGIQVILSLLTQQFERLQCWYYCWEGFFKYTIEIGSDAVIHMPSFIKIGSGIQKLFGGWICIQTRRHQDDLVSLLLL